MQVTDQPIEFRLYSVQSMQLYLSGTQVGFAIFKQKDIST